MAPNDFTPWLGVFETLKVIDGVPLFVREHRAELRRAMAILGLKSDFDFPAAAAQLPGETGRWRWLVTPEGAKTLFSPEPEMPNEPVALSLSPIRVGSANWDARFKTVSYLSHIQAWKTATTPEVILLNERGEIASASRANLFWATGGRLHTPAHEAGCRCGVVRQFILQRTRVETGYFPLSALLEADEVFFTNSMRGIVSVSEAEGRKWHRHPMADSLRAAYAQEIANQFVARRGA